MEENTKNAVGGEASRAKDGETSRAKDGEKKKLTPYVRVAHASCFVVGFAVGICLMVALPRLRTAMEERTALRIEGPVRDVPADYASMLVKKSYAWSLGEEMTVEIAFARAYPFEGMVRFVFEGIVRTGATNKPCSMTVSVEPRISGHEIVPCLPKIVEFELNGNAEADLGCALFSLFLRDALLSSWTLPFEIVRIVDMTSANVAVVVAE